MKLADFHNWSTVLGKRLSKILKMKEAGSLGITSVAQFEAVYRFKK